MLLQNLLNHPELADFLCEECREKEVGVRFSNAINPSDYLIIKIDEYFREYMRERIPAGIDCLIVQRCTDNNYKLYLIELKKIKDLGGYDLNHIRSKFQNCFDIFMSDKFRDFFYDLTINFKSIQLIFVSTTSENKNRKDKFQKNTRLDALLSMRPCRFANKFHAISFEEPDPLVIPCWHYPSVYFGFALSNLKNDLRDKILYVNIEDEIHLLMVFDKSDFENVGDSFLEALVKTIE